MSLQRNTASELVAKITERKKAYLALYVAAIADLEEFCRAKRTCVIPGDRDMTMILEGRREVYLRIMNYRDKEVHDLVKEILQGVEETIGAPDG
jgi:hypothetical protein